MNKNRCILGFVCYHYKEHIIWLYQYMLMSMAVIWSHGGSVDLLKVHVPSHSLCVGFSPRKRLNHISVRPVEMLTCAFDWPTAWSSQTHTRQHNSPDGWLTNALLTVGVRLARWPLFYGLLKNSNRAHAPNQCMSFQSATYYLFTFL